MGRRSQPLFAADGGRLDELDLHILKVLHEDARTSNADLSALIDLSQSATLQRVRRLEASGAIKRYIAEADEAVFEPWSQMLITVELTWEGQKRREEFEANALGAREVVEAVELAGVSNYLLRAALPSAAHWPDLRDSLDPMRCLIKRAEIALAVRTLKARAPHPLLFPPEG